MAIRLSVPDTGELRPFVTGHDETTIYICGVTPYDAAHLGHIATFMTYDVLVRRLHELGHRTRVVRNITDLDEPILGRAQKLGVPYRQLVEEEITQLRTDLTALNFLPPDREPLASEMLSEIIVLARELEAAGHTYVVNDRLLFDVTTARDFGKAAGYSLDLMRHYARERGGDPDDPRKRSPLDFVLWRPALPGEPVYDSPWGAGMPGWHIGCSAMVRALLGETVDLHGGGIDLRFPHHACEAAQSLATQSAPFVRFWLHCEFVRYRGTKMSKSLGNVVLARDLLRKHAPGAVRLAILYQYRYGAGFEWRDRDINEGQRLFELLQTAANAPSGPRPEPWAERVRAAVDDDLDFPSAVAELAGLARAVLSGVGDDTRAPLAVTELASLLGVDLSGSHHSVQQQRGALA